MAREYAKQLTRQDLEDYGIIDVQWFDGEWVIKRHWYGPGKHIKKRTYTMTIFDSKGPHKYVEDHYAPMVQFSYNKKTVPIPVGRLVWAWHKGIVPAKIEVAYKDHDPYNMYYNFNDDNDPKNNLYLRTIEERIKEIYTNRR